MNKPLKEDYIQYRINLANATSHSGVKRQFSKYYIVTGKIDKTFGKVYAKIFDLRQRGD